MNKDEHLFRKVVRHITTCRDNESFDMGKVCGCSTLLMNFLFTGYDVFVLQHVFNAIAFGGSCTSIITGTCLGLFFKKDTEPTGEERRHADRT